MDAADIAGEWRIKMESLKSLNKLCFVVHLLTGLICFISSKNSATISTVLIPAKTSFTDWDEDTEIAYQALETVYEVPLATAASFISFGAATLHALNLIDWEAYEQELGN